MPPESLPGSLSWAVGLFLIFLCLIAFSSFIRLRIVSEVNRKLPDDQQVGYFFWYYRKARRLMGLHREFYPKSNIILLYRSCVGLAAVCGLVWVWIFGLLR